MEIGGKEESVTRLYHANNKRLLVFWEVLRTENLTSYGVASELLRLASTAMMLALLQCPPGLLRSPVKTTGGVISQFELLWFTSMFSLWKWEEK